MPAPQKKKDRPFWKKIRIPLPRRKGGFHSGPKGKRGYDRRKAKREAQREIEDS